MNLCLRAHLWTIVSPAHMASLNEIDHRGQNRLGGHYLLLLYNTKIWLLFVELALAKNIDSPYDITDIHYIVLKMFTDLFSLCDLCDRHYIILTMTYI